MYIEEGLEESVNQFMDLSQPSMKEALGMEFVSFKKDEVKAMLPVDANTVQPFGILHGGASVALAETIASVGAWLNVGPSKTAVGVEINANHIRSVKKGNKVTGTAQPVHRGRSIHVWEVKIHTEDQKLVCVSRCTLMIVEAKSEK